MEKVQVKFGEWIEKGFNLYKANFGILVLVSLIAVALSTVTLGVLAGPMMAGVLLITMSLFDSKEPKPEVGDLFKGFNYFLQTFLFVLIWGVALFIASFILNMVPCVGQLASICLVFAAEAFLMFALFLIVDKEMNFWSASIESFNKVKTNFWPFLGLAVVASIIGAIGAIACVIGVVFTLPIQLCILTVAYREVFGGVETPTRTEEAPLKDAKTGGEPSKPAQLFHMDVASDRQSEAHLSEKWVGGEKPSPFLSWNRPHSFWDVVGVHFPLAIVTGIPLLLSNWVPCNLLPLKPCTFLQLTGYPCPFCGFTRSFWAIAQGNWAFAVYNYPLACFVYIFTVLVFAWNITGLLLGVKITRGKFLQLTPCQLRWAIIIVTILFILNWAYRLSLGLKQLFDRTIEP